MDEWIRLCVCGHTEKHHAMDDPNWKTAVCLTQFYVDPSECGCEEFVAKAWLPVISPKG